MAEQTFPLNAWYSAAWDHEIKHALSKRTICGRDVVLYRRGDGGVVESGEHESLHLRLARGRRVRYDRHRRPACLRTS